MIRFSWDTLWDHARQEDLRVHYKPTLEVQGDWFTDRARIIASMHSGNRIAYVEQTRSVSRGRTVYLPLDRIHSTISAPNAREYGYRRVC